MTLTKEDQDRILLSELKSLSEVIHRRYYSHVSHWRPLDDPRGVLSQIDNMTAGLLMRIEQLEQAITWVSPEFVNEDTSADEMHRRIGFLNRDAAREI
jgi:hypothetical protein